MQSDSLNNMLPHVDFAVLLHPAQSESENAIKSLHLPWYLHSNPTLGTPVRYLERPRSFFMCPTGSFAIPLQISSVACNTAPSVAK